MTFVFTFFIIIRRRAIIECALVYEDTSAQLVYEDTSDQLVYEDTSAQLVYEDTY